MFLLIIQVKLHEHVDRNWASQSLCLYNTATPINANLATFLILSVLYFRPPAPELVGHPPQKQER